ncbi:hypothetical protein OBE_04248 [human gut metagenome]|uniref:Uncharacterized protein n=1 Tax=human gut metagenome TaxID=408170 RepID=K1UE09_9ZZZZ
MVSTLKNVRQELKSNIPYLQKLFAEQMDKTVTEAKGEFETYLQNKMNSIALAAISEQMKQEEISLNRNMIPEWKYRRAGKRQGRWKRECTWTCKAVLILEMKWVPLFFIRKEGDEVKRRKGMR